MKTGTESAHKLLELLITKALISGKAKSSSVRISYAELAQAMGQKAEYDTDLLIRIKLSWEAPEDEHE